MNSDQSEIDEEEEIPVQDSARENMLISMFSLVKNPNRLGPDAFDEHGNPFELKTTTQSSVGTARDVSFEMIQEWRKRYWIIAKGANLASGFRIDAVYFLDPSRMEDAFQKIENHMKPDIELGEKALSILKGKLSREEVERLKYLISRGATLNNPKIPWWYVEERGIEITGDYAKRLRELVSEYPLGDEGNADKTNAHQKTLRNYVETDSPS